ncbi:MAG: sialate O-acetylesterase [Melioribacteraceae bacterium]|nr:sialate O-acetylesterase [Melioribacteraceae bacterium]
MKVKIGFFLLMISSLISFGQSDLSLPKIFSDNMVLQQQTDASIWGKGIPGKIVTVKSDWGESVDITVTNDSSWLTRIKTPIAGGPYSLIISDGKNSIIYKNILIGEVWLCSGQSNMEMPLEGWPPNDIILDSEKEIRNSENDNIRFFTVSRDISVTERDDCIGHWETSSPSTSSSFSATAYFFGKKLFDELKIPIGLIHSSWGGTPAEAWTNKEYLETIPEFNETLKKIDESIPVSHTLDKWLDKLPKVYITEKVGESPWSNLEFNDIQYSEADYDHSEWSLMDLPNRWEQTDLGEFDGVVWFRREIDLTDSWLNKKLRVELGPIDDFDVTYCNGVKIGAIEEEGNWQTNRNYEISSELNNRNTISLAVRVNDTRGGGGIYGNPEQMKLINIETGEEISISGKWSYRPVAEFRGMVYYVFGGDNQLFNSRPKLPIGISSNTPTLLYNAMISPLVPFSIKGVIWYQGEANTGNPILYERLFPTMINNWRDSFGIHLPFYFVQIAPYDYGDETKSELLRDAQRKTLVLDNTGMAVTLDIGNVNNIHPANKKDVGERLALWALGKQYNKNVVYSGPLYKSMKIIGNKIELEFEYSGGGLELRDVDSQFKIAGVNKEFLSAKVEIKNDKLIVWSDEIKNPIAVRYAMKNISTASLFNKEGLPASSFRTDDWIE